MAKRICTHCKTENLETSNYCRRCGFVLPGGSTEVSSDKTLVSKIKDLQNRVSEVEAESKSKDNDLVNLANEKSALKQSLTKLQAENGNLRSSISSANQRADKAEQDVKKAETKLSESESGKSTLHLLYIILVGAALIFGVAQCNKNHDKDSEVSSLNSEITSLNSDKSRLSEQVYSLSSKNTSLTETNKSLSDILEKVGSKTPLFLGDVSVRNQGEQYNSTIYSRNTTYINPKVEIFSLIEGSVKLYVKFITPTGLSQGTGKWYTAGYSYSGEFYLHKHQNNTCEFDGWGNTTKGNWSSGNYRYEFYYNGKCIGSKSFTIY